MVTSIISFFWRVESVLYNRKSLYKTHSFFLFFFVLLSYLISWSNTYSAAPRTPSQSLPKMFQRPDIIDFYEFKKQEQVIPALPSIELEQQSDTGITIIPETIIILAPEILQNVIDLNKYKEQLVGQEQNIKSLYSVALQIEQDFNLKGFPLVRVILPTQELEPQQATIFFKVIDGFIEQVDLSDVPKNQILRTYYYLKPLIKKKALKLKQMERQLLLAGNLAGIKLTSTLEPGEKEGATRLVVKAEHQLISGGISFDNSQNKELARQQGQIRTEINSPFGLGETISLFGLARPTEKGMKGTGRSVPIRAGGISMSLPIGNEGLTTGLSYMESMTRPGGDVEELDLEANLKSASATISYPVLYQRNMALFTRASVNWTDEVQHTGASGTDEDLTHDRVTSLRIGSSLNACFIGCLGLDAEISKGIEIGSRSNSQVGDGTPLSRASATSNYTHFRLNANYSVSPIENYVLRVNTGGQYTLDDLLNSEQTGITGENKLSGLSSGAISGDEAWYVRGQLNRNIMLGNSLQLSPYLYSAGGVAYINQPTAAERSATAAKAVGMGIEVSGGDSYFFDKSISGKVEISKNWATSNLEDTSDVRLNKQQIFVRLSMNF